MTSEVTEKRCNRCRWDKPVAEFDVLASSPDGLQPRCRPCQDAVRRKRPGRASKWDEHPEQGRRCIDCGLEKTGKEFSKAVCGKGGLHPVCKLCASARQTAIRQKDPYSVMFNAKRTHCARKGLKFTLVLEDYRHLLTESDTCPVPGCGVVFRSLLAKGQDENSRTIDRLIPTDGYVPGNCVCICNRCNRYKTDLSPTRLRAMADWIEAELAARVPAASESD